MRRVLGFGRASARVLWQPCSYKVERICWFSFREETATIFSGLGASPPLYIFYGGINLFSGALSAHRQQGEAGNPDSARCTVYLYHLQVCYNLRNILTVLKANKLVQL